MLRKRQIDIRAAYERALWEPLDFDEIKDMSVSTRCALIKKVLEAQSNGTNHENVFGMSRISLERLAKSFDITEEFHDWQSRKRRVFTHELTANDNETGKLILDSFRNWDSISVEQQQTAVVESAKLHAASYAEGVCEPIPYDYVFKDGAFRRSSKGVTLVLGGFCGDVVTGRANITQYMQHGMMPNDPLDAFTTAHHETTHLLQHFLACASYRNMITPAHPLHREALYFREVDRHKANIPSSSFAAYRAQPYEVLAELEGSKIASTIQALAL